MAERAAEDVGARRRLRERRAVHASDRSAGRGSGVASLETQLTEERDQLAREVHDILAHTLGATSLQLTALDVLLAADGASAGVRDHVAALHRLVGEGLDEARDAVRALRADSSPLIPRLARLCDLHGTVPEVRGEPRRLAPETALTVYRVAQEALTNAEKHAPGAPVKVALSFDRARGTRIDNEHGTFTPPGPLARSSGKQGLLGMRERVALIGGHLDVGPTVDGWRVGVELATPHDHR